MKFLKNYKENSTVLYWALIITFAVLYLATAFVSWYHSITLFNIANEQWLSIIVSFVAEIGQASVLFSLLLTKNKNKLLPWIIMIILTSLQVIGNVVSSYKFIETSKTLDFVYFQDSILFWVTVENTKMFKIIIAWITGGILPIVALSMTALVADNIKLAETQEEVIEEKQLTAVTEPVNYNLQPVVNNAAKEAKDYVDNPEDYIDNPLVENNMPEAEINDERLEEIIRNEVQKRLEEANERYKKEVDIDNSLENLLESEISGDILNSSEVEDANSIMAQYIDNGKYRYTYIPAVDEPIIDEVVSEVTPEIVEPVKELTVPIVYTQEESIAPIVETPVIKKPKPKPPFNKVPVNKISGWHLMKEFVDKEGNIFNKGKFVKHDKKRKPTEPKKA